MNSKRVLAIAMFFTFFLKFVPPINADTIRELEEELMVGQVFDRTMTVRGKLFYQVFERTFSADESFKEVLTVIEKPGPNGQNFISINLGFRNIFNGRLPLVINQVKPYAQSVVPYINSSIQNSRFVKLIDDPDLGKEEL